MLKIRWSDRIGFRDKTLWDWMQLLIIPIILVVGAYLLNESARQSEQSIADQRLQIERNIASNNIDEAALQTYLDRMTELLLKEKLRESEKDSEVRAVARARTLTVLRRLDGERKGALIRFLYEADLIDKDKRVIDLSGADLSNALLGGAVLREADLSGADLVRAFLRDADLSGANLSEVDLVWADLMEAVLSEADLSGAKLMGADLRDADLSRANLSEAFLIDTDLSGKLRIEAKLRGVNLSYADLSYVNLGEADLSEAKLRGVNLSRAEYDEHTQWPEGFDPDTAGAIRVNE